MEVGKSDEIIMRKGPWMAEEDEILMEYVKKHGPRNWSSIRSKGLLPRTGKSCRLRWVNKLKPNLKSGCKFSAEEEKIVLELQAQFGNKWARIATHLPGRTDNDVKNFWSTRQKRLTRILHASHQPTPQKNREKLVTFSEMPSIEQTCRMNVNPFQEENSETRSCGPVYSTDLFNVLVSPETLNQSFRIKDEKPPEEFLSEEKMMIPWEMPLQVSFPYLPQTSLEFPTFLENQDIAAVGMDDLLMFQGFSGIDEGSKFPSSLQVLGSNESHRLEIGKEDKDSNTPDSIFDDFPADMFDWDPLQDSSYL